MAEGSIAERFDATVAWRENGDAVVFPGTRATYRELQDSSRRTARALHAAGLGPGDLVGLLVAADRRNVELLLGLWRIGAVPVPVNPRLKGRELLYVVEHSKMVVLIADREGVALAEQAGVGCPTMDTSDHERFLAAGEAVSEEQVAKLGEAVGPDHDAMILYTSGTTSNPKGAVHLHRSLLSEGRKVAEHLGLGPEDRFWSPLPMFHCGGFCTMAAAWHNGSAFCHVGQFEPGVALDQLERERCTFAFPAFETIWLGVLDHPRFPQADLSAIRVVVNVGVPERLRQMQERLPTALQISCFGSTESCGFMCMGGLDDPLDVRCTTSGRPMPGMDLRVIDAESGAAARVGAPGEALFRGDSRFDRYHRDPDYTAQVIDDEGFFHSGDLVALDAEGRVSFLGRLKDMLKVGGENVSAAEIEDYLATHPAVHIVAVVAAPDARYIEVPCAYVELVPGQTVTEEELIEHCLGRIATFKVPRYVRFVSEWPLSGTKIQKFRLRERIAAELRAAGISEAPRMSSSRG